MQEVREPITEIRNEVGALISRPSLVFTRPFYIHSIYEALTLVSFGDETPNRIYTGKQIKKHIEEKIEEALRFPESKPLPVLKLFSAHVIEAPISGGELWLINLRHPRAEHLNCVIKIVEEQ